MKLSTTAAAPLLFAATMLTAGVLAATQANAGERLSDVAYVNAARCAGLAHGLNQDAAINAGAVEAFSAQREPLALVMAQSAHDDAARSSRRGPYGRSQAQADLQSHCQSVLSQNVARTDNASGDQNSGR